MRITWVDNAKAIGIFLVVMGHFVDVEIVKAYIYSFHMPLFFFLSGYLFTKKDTFNIFLKKKFNTLVIPYFIFAFIGAIFYALRLKYGDNPGQVEVLQKFINIFLWKDYWFLGALFIVSIAYHILSVRIRSVFSFLVATVVCVGIHVLLYHKYFEFMNNYIKLCFLTFVCYSAGRLAQIRINFHSPFMMLAPITNIFIFYFAYPHIGFESIEWCDNHAYYILVSFSGILTVSYLSNAIGASKLLAFIGSNTLIIYILDRYPQPVIRRAMENIFGVYNFSYTPTDYAVLYAVVSLLILTPFIIMINRWFPFVIGRSPWPSPGKVFAEHRIRN